MYGLLQSMRLQQEYMNKYNELSKKLISAQKVGATECQQCGLCCWKRPCSFTKEEFYNLSNYLKLTPQELFQKYFIVDEIDNGVMLLARRKNQDDIVGTYIPCERTYDIDSPCVFLNDNGQCDIYDVRTEDAKHQRCWEKYDNKSHYVWDEQDLIEIGWDGIKY